jgi:hypothetical protein
MSINIHLINDPMKIFPLTINRINIQKFQNISANQKLKIILFFGEI